MKNMPGWKEVLKIEMESLIKLDANHMLTYFIVSPTMLKSN